MHCIERLPSSACPHIGCSSLPSRKPSSDGAYQVAQKAGLCQSYVRVELLIYASRMSELKVGLRQSYVRVELQWCAALPKKDMPCTLVLHPTAVQARVQPSAQNSPHPSAPTINPKLTTSLFVIFSVCVRRRSFLLAPEPISPSHSRRMRSVPSQSR